MKRQIFPVLLLALAFPAVGAESTVGSGKPVNSLITQVVVFADRAQVMREAKANLSGPVDHFEFAKLPGWIDEGSVRLTLSPASAGEILDVEVQRTFLARASDEEFRKAEAAVQETADLIAALDDEKAVLEAQAKHVESIRTFSIEKMPRDAATREIKKNEYEENLAFVTVSLREISNAKRELEKKRRALQPELAARQRSLEDLRQRSQLDERTVVVTAKGTGAANLRLVYMVPGATWEPVHELRATPDGKSVAIASHAVIRQTSGEDWSGVTLALSTQRSTDTMKIPELDALLLGSSKKIARVTAAAQSSFDVANRNFEGNNGTWFNLFNPAQATQQEFAANKALIVDNIRRVEVVFQNLQERGTTAHFPAMGAQTLRSDGRPVRVPLGQLELSAQHRVLAAPEISLNAAHTVDLSNSGKQALLPGKVSLFMDGAFLGLTETDFVAPGESFSLYLGVANEIKLSRTLDKKRSELRRGGQRTKVQASFIVTVENLSKAEASVQLADRVPVSQTDEVKVSGLRITPEVKPDAQGLLRWDISLNPKQEKSFRIEYAIEYPTDLLQRKAAAPAQSESTVDIQLHESIRSLERKF